MMKVTVVQRAKSTGAVIATPEITIGENCPKCGEKRGEPFGYNFWEDGTSHWCQCWKNTCGHIDKYGDVLVESKGFPPKGR